MGELNYTRAMTRRLGLLGGMSWTSSAEYYRLLNKGYQARVGGVSSAPLLLWSFDFGELEAMQSAGDWSGLAGALQAAGLALAEAGAGALVICANTMHKVAEPVEQASGIEVLHIGDAAGEAIRREGLERVGLLGTRFTMGEAFYRDRLEQRYGIEVVVPDAPDATRVDRIIYEELVCGRIVDESRDELRRIIAGLAQRGAQAAVLGCTELSLLADAGASPLPLIDTTAEHVCLALDWLLAE